MQTSICQQLFVILYGKRTNGGNSTFDTCSYINKKGIALSESCYFFLLFTAEEIISAVALEKKALQQLLSQIFSHAVPSSEGNGRAPHRRAGASAIRSH